MCNDALINFLDEKSFVTFIHCARRKTKQKKKCLPMSHQLAIFKLTIAPRISLKQLNNNNECNNWFGIQNGFQLRQIVKLLRIRHKTKCDKRQLNILHLFAVVRLCILHCADVCCTIMCSCLRNPKRKTKMNSINKSGKRKQLENVRREFNS